MLRKIVKFKLGRLRLDLEPEATFVQVMMLEEVMYSLDMRNHKLTMVGQADLVHYPQLANALSDVNRLGRNMGSLDKREQSELLDQLVLGEQGMVGRRERAKGKNGDIAKIVNKLTLFT